ncbi:MAG: ABC transporter permease subunit [Hyphomicrobiales bacterium]
MARDDNQFIFKKFLAKLFGCVVLLALWEILSLYNHPTLIPSPDLVLWALLDYIFNPSFWLDSLLPSLLHIIFGFLGAAVIGISLGVMAGNISFIRYMFSPLRVLTTSMPAAVGVVLFITWLGLGSTMVIVMVAVFIAPIFYMALCDGFDKIDYDLNEMLQFYNVSLVDRLRHFIIPSLWGGLSPAIRIAIANSARLTILAEIFAATSGLGERVDTARTYLQTEKLFALLIVMVLIVVFFDKFAGILLARYDVSSKHKGQSF